MQTFTQLYSIRYTTKNSTSCYSIVGWTMVGTTWLSWLNSVVERIMLLNEQCCWTNNVVKQTMLLNEQCCRLLFQQCCWTNNVVERTMLLNEQCCSLLFQQCCSTNNVVHYCFNNVVERTMLFTIVSTMLFSIDEATTVVHGCWNRRKEYW